MKQYVFKPYKESTDTEKSPDSNEAAPEVKSKPVPKTMASRCKQRKLAIKHQLACHRRPTSLDVGTLQANVRRVRGENSILQSQIVWCVQDAVRDAASVKRKGQRIIGRFIEHINRVGLKSMMATDVEDSQAGKDIDKDEGEEGLDDQGSTSVVKKSDHGPFIMSFLTHIYTGNYSKASGIRASKMAEG
ncbi:hypothetical protein EC968_001864 [Mortierella alpina]|nr:hypothetical protein EC968_001864 [Mortierella alpina]